MPSLVCRRGLLYTVCPPEGVLPKSRTNNSRRTPLNLHISTPPIESAFPAIMSLNEKPVTGAHVVEANVQSTSTNLLPPHCSFDNASSTTSLTPTYDQNSTPTEEYTPSSEHPFSPFYLHPTTRTSFEQHQSESKVHIRIHEQDDLEAASTNFPSSEVSRNHKENAVWPCNNQKHKRSLMMERRKGGCSPLRGLSKNQKLWAKIIIALVVIGAAVGIGIGISKAVGAGVWKNANSQGKIGSGS